MTFFRSLFNFTEKPAPLLKNPTIIIRSVGPYPSSRSADTMSLPPYPHEEFPVKVTTPREAMTFGYGASSEGAKPDDHGNSTIGRASNRDTNPFSDRHRLRASSSATVNDRASIRASRMSSFSNRGSKIERRRSMLLTRQPSQTLGTASNPSLSDAFRSPVADERRSSILSSIASDESELYVSNEPIEVPEKVRPPSSDPDDSTPQETKDAETVIGDQPASQTVKTSPVRRLPAKHSFPATSKIPRLIKIESQAPLQVQSPAVLFSAFSEPDSETQRLSVLSISSEQSAASSNTFSFTTGCSSEFSFGSNESTESSTSTVRPRRDSSSSTSTIVPTMAQRFPVDQESMHKSSASTIKSTKPQYILAHAQNLKPKSKSSSSLELDLPPGALFVSREEYKDYSYVVYTDKKGRSWGKMYPKKMKKSL